MYGKPEISRNRNLPYFNHSFEQLELKSKKMDPFIYDT